MGSVRRARGGRQRERLLNGKSNEAESFHAMIKTTGELEDKIFEKSQETQQLKEQLREKDEEIATLLEEMEMELSYPDQPSNFENKGKKIHECVTSNKPSGFVRHLD